MRRLTALESYRRSAAHRSVRQQEADVFHQVNATLRRAADGPPIERAKAIADCERLWMSVTDLVADPANALPTETRAALLSLGHSVQRELKAAEPSFSFLININQEIAAGLSTE